VILEQGPRLSASVLGPSVRSRTVSSVAVASPARPRASTSPSTADVNEPIASIGMTVDEATRRLILRTLEATRFNRTKAAALLGVSSKTLYNKLKAWEIDVESYLAGTNGREAAPGAAGV
jgi:DNA-binding NtrC family response regulator